ncbi:hypothetical protein Ddye_030226 [Dipteronia dyeriana]|uniref:RNase H type-1 domain-containing protein n=1 Tax=Dipteronia dyeriana TaxID=168575 RepID=A0AAD9TH07_9ROSI|nr:hypothetical protein Ddye_030226 [Dipteronia dyeriana]
MIDDVDAILSLHFSSVGRRDSLIWHYDKRGSFSVKSVYHLAYSLLENSSGSDTGLGVDGGDLIYPSWRPLDNGFFKINTDASIDASRGRVGIGAIIRDHEGMVLASCAQVIQLNYSPVLAEAIAILKGLRFAVESGIWPCMIESDAQVVVSMINSDLLPLDEIGLVINDIVDLLRSLPQFKVCFISRKANMAVHCLAKLGLSLESDLFCWRRFYSLSLIKFSL